MRADGPITFSMNGKRSTKKRSDRSRQPASAQSPQGCPWSIRRRAIVSVLVSIHVAAVFIPPFTFATSRGPGEASPFAVPLMRVWQPYVDTLFLNHGYFFFSPNPGPNHLLRVELRFGDDRPAESYLIPDRSRLWPRLYYHRHFMMTETLHSLYAPPEPPPEIVEDPAAVQRWRQARDRYEWMRDSFVRHIQAETGADRVWVTRVEHRQPTPYEFLEEGIGLTDPRLYRDLPD